MWAIGMGRACCAQWGPPGRLSAILVLAASALWCALGWQTTPAQSAPDPQFLGFVEGVWPEAQAAGVSRPTFERAFRGVEPDLTLPDLVLPGRPGDGSQGQAEFTRPPQDYVARGQMIQLASQGQALKARHAATLVEVERQLGVDGPVVLAIWGRETAYGAHRSPHYAIRVLATQAYTGRRKELFRTELIAGLRLLQDGTLTVETMRSSWAGAMGLTQFMPTEFYNAGHDLDRDGRIDLFNSIPDALGSAAKQLQQKGWTKGLPWGFEVRMGPSADCAHEGPVNARSLADWVKLGVVRADGLAFAPEHLTHQAYMMSPGGSFGPQFLVTNNFKVLRAYNTSDLYALFVGHLADRIAGSGDFRAPWAQIKQLAPKDIGEVQQRLKDRGFAMDKIDGKIGSNTRWQIGLYQRTTGVPVDCWPTDRLLADLRRVAGR